MSKKRQLVFIELDQDATPLLSGSPQRVRLNPFVAKPTAKQYNMYAALGLPSVVIPKPKPRKAKPVPKEQLTLF